MAAVDGAGRSVRTYGNFARPRTAGLWGLGSLGTMALLGGLVVVVLAVMLGGLVAGLIVAAPLALMLMGVVRRDRHGANLIERLTVRTGWWLTRTKGMNLYRSGPLGRIAWGTHQLPGIAAATTLSEHRDSWDRPFALLTCPATATYTVVLGSQPDGSALVDPEQVDAWVAGWGHWLAALGDLPGLEAAAVTVESAPDSGARLRREVEFNLHRDAPPFAAAMLEEIVQTYPHGSSSVRAYLALTFNAATRAGGRRRPAPEMSQELATRLPGLTATLSATGAGAAHPLSAQELCEVVRLAFDPACAPLIDAAHASGQVPHLSWSDVGPSAMQASWSDLRHDSGLSRTWAMTAAPRGTVVSQVLANLIAPHPTVDRKRVSLLYRPIDPARAAAIVEADLRAAEFRASATTKAAARDVRSVRAAQATAAEEASGAALVQFGMLLTATVTDPARAGDAYAAVEGLAAGARLLIRPMYGSQDSGFVGGLPLGMVLPKHLKLPVELREML